jgi:hypothetical protein
MVLVGDGWYRCQVAISAAIAGSNPVVIGATTGDNVSSYAGTAGSGIFIWGAQLELGSTATAYQRVTSTFDVTEAGQPDNFFLSFDGIDDSMSTPSIDFTGTDKMTVFAGVQRLSDAAGNVVLGHGADFGTSSAFEFQANTGPNQSTAFRGRSSLGSVSQAGFIRAVPTLQPFVFSAFVDYAQPAGSEFFGRYSGVFQAQNVGTTEENTGVFGNNALTLGARQGGASLRFNGQIYSLIVRGALTDLPTIQRTERYVAAKTAGVSIP